MEGRCRIVTEIIRGIRNACGDYPICVRINADDFVGGGITLPYAVEIAKLLEKGSHLGGTALLAAVPPYKSMVAELVKTLEAELRELQVEVRLNTPATAKELRALQPCALRRHRRHRRPENRPSCRRPGAGKCPHHGGYPDKAGLPLRQAGRRHWRRDGGTGNRPLPQRGEPCDHGGDDGRAGPDSALFQELQNTAERLAMAGDCAAAGSILEAFHTGHDQAWFL